VMCVDICSGRSIHRSPLTWDDVDQGWAPIVTGRDAPLALDLGRLHRPLLHHDLDVDLALVRLPLAWEHLVGAQYGQCVQLDSAGQASVATHRRQSTQAQGVGTAPTCTLSKSCSANTSRSALRPSSRL
jgi:hypothetical protein